MSDPEKSFKNAQKLVETVIREIKLDPDKNRLKSNKPGRVCWKLRRGSAPVYVFLDAGERENYLQIVSPILRLPEANQLGLFRKILELNAEVVYGAAFGVKGDEVVLSADRPTTDLDKSEVMAMLTTVGRYADEYDDKLREEFNAEPPTEAV